MRVAVIPARGGSKRIPRKNIRLFAGRPMIAWPIAAARSSGLFDRIVVSTDDDEIAAVAIAAGAEAPFRRPPELSDDHTPTRPVVADAIRRLGAEAAQVCCLYPTAPFLSPDDLRAGLALLTDGGFRYAFSVTTYPYPIQRALRRTDAGGVEMIQPEHRQSRSQDLEETFHDAGQFYWGQAQAFLNDEPVFTPASAPVVLPTYRVQDIDTPDDWIRAELMFRALGLGADQDA